MGAPRRYVQGADIIDTIGAELKAIGHSAVLLTDARVGGIVGDRVAQSAAAADVAVTPLNFAGEITYAEIARLAGEARDKGFDIVIGAGGGKTIDTGKILSREIGAKFVSLPTVASNDSPTSHIAVIYDENHKLVGVEKNRGNPELVFVDTAIIAKAPLTLLSAGVGDALVKCFEVEQCIASGGQNVFGARSPLSALALAQACYRTVRAHTAKAFEAARRGEPDDDFEALVEAAVLMSGLAFESGGLSVSHGMTRGLSAVPAIANALHGHQVAYGLLVQLVLEKRDDAFLADIRDFYKTAELPLKLADLGLEKGSNSALGIIADASAGAAHMKKFIYPVTAEGILAAIRTIESW
ncbi:glycerol dehydrogenase [Pseudochelatococcus sp. B33]